MSSSVLREFGIDCVRTRAAKLRDYQLFIQPRVNLVWQRGAIAYGAIASVCHVELEELYNGIEKTYKKKYFPFPVGVEFLDQTEQVALCYMAEPFNDGMADWEYIKQMKLCAREVQAPNDYIARIESFQGVE